MHCRHTGDRVDAHVLAHIGEPFAIDESDRVLKAALETGEFTAVNSITGNARGQGQLLAAIAV